MLLTFKITPMIAYELLGFGYYLTFIDQYCVLYKCIFLITDAKLSSQQRDMFLFFFYLVYIHI